MLGEIVKLRKITMMIKIRNAAPACFFLKNIDCEYLSSYGSKNVRMEPNVHPTCEF